MRALFDFTVAVSVIGVPASTEWEETARVVVVGCVEACRVTALRPKVASTSKAPTRYMIRPKKSRLLNRGEMFVDN